MNTQQSAQVLALHGPADHPFHAIGPDTVIFTSHGTGKGQRWIDAILGGTDPAEWVEIGENHGRGIEGDIADLVEWFQCDKPDGFYLLESEAREHIEGIDENGEPIGDRAMFRNLQVRPFTCRIAIETIYQMAKEEQAWKNRLYRAMCEEKEGNL